MTLLTIVNQSTTTTWIAEPRWSWYRTPLWQCDANELCITVMDLNSTSSWIQTYWLYFTDQEYVMWKLLGVVKEDINFDDLRQGVFYS
jgi:hypothetical protein